MEHAILLDQHVVQMPAKLSMVRSGKLAVLTGDIHDVNMVNIGKHDVIFVNSASNQLFLNAPISKQSYKFLFPRLLLKFITSI